MRSRGMGWPPFDDLFKDIERDIGSVIGSTCKKAFGYGSPVDIKEDQEGYTLLFDVPGVDRKDITILVDDGTLIVKGERNIGDDETYRERSSGEFSRSFKLPDNVNREDVKAKLASGVLEVRLSKSPETKPKKIEIK